MNYQRIYDMIVSKAQVRNTPKGADLVVESHHIIPSHCGGSDDKSNLVNLTLREHFMCHLLLAKIYKGTEFYAGMCRAVVAMSEHGNKNSRAYQAIREAHILNLRKQTISEEQKLAISVANTGNKYAEGNIWSEEQHAKLQATWTEEKRKEEGKKSIGRNVGEKNGMFGKDPWNKNAGGYKIDNYPKNRKSVSDEVTEARRKSATGQKRTTEQKENLSKARKLWWANKKQEELKNAV